MSEETFTHRLDQLLSGRLIDPARLIGDLSFRPRASWSTRALAAIRGARRPFESSSRAGAPAEEILLALDWAGGTSELIVGRHHSCDVVLDELSVSRRHARLVFRDGEWVLQDLESTNGTLLNGLRIGRCAVRPGDRVALGEIHLRID